MDEATRWENLLADLGSAFDAAAALDLAGEVADRTRHEAGRLRLVDRLRGSLGAQVTAGLRGVGPRQGRLAETGGDWFLLVEPGGPALVPLAAVTWLTGLAAGSAEPGSEGRLAARLDLRSALRALVRDRAPVAVWLVDGSLLTGTLDRVGADFVELAEHDPGEPRRPVSVRGSRTVPLAALAVVRPG